MCLGIPGRVHSWLNQDDLFATANIEFGGISRPCNMVCVPEAQVGDFVIVHAGVAICRIDAAEAARVLAELERLELADLESSLAAPADAEFKTL
jgi:hydrogenase expression/formation protein HypC